jgi:hypothetical protein
VTISRREIPPVNLNRQEREEILKFLRVLGVLRGLVLRREF